MMFCVGDGHLRRQNPLRDIPLPLATCIAICKLARRYPHTLVALQLIVALISGSYAIG